jgi:Na+-transporting methylmalonyl-CoA/oxaloacetate decarboxylase gamma subunit
MTIADMFGQSVILAFIGTATVFLFLAVLVFFISIMARIVKALGWDRDIRQAPEVSGSDEMETVVAAAIATAVHKHQIDGV